MDEELRKRERDALADPGDINARNRLAAIKSRVETGLRFCPADLVQRVEMASQTGIKPTAETAQRFYSQLGGIWEESIQQYLGAVHCVWQLTGHAPTSDQISLLYTVLLLRPERYAYGYDEDRDNKKLFADVTQRMDAHARQEATDNAYLRAAKIIQNPSNDTLIPQHLSHIKYRSTLNPSDPVLDQIYYAILQSGRRWLDEPTRIFGTKINPNTVKRFYDSLNVKGRGDAT